MNNSKKTFVIIIGIASAVIFTGCSTNTTVSHDFANYTKLSKQDAIQIIASRRGRLPISDQFTRMEKVDETGFDYAADNKPSNEWFLLAGAPLGPLAGPAAGQMAFAAAEKNSSGYHPHLGRVNFSDVWKIKLMTYPFNNDSGIRLFLHNEPHDYFDILCHKDQPEVNNAILSAFLSLCPNVK